MQHLTFITAMCPGNINRFQGVRSWCWVWLQGADVATSSPRYHRWKAGGIGAAFTLLYNVDILLGPSAKKIFNSPEMYDWQFTQKLCPKTCLAASTGIVSPSVGMVVGNNVCLK